MPTDQKAMKVVTKSSRIVKPTYHGDPPPTTLHIPLSVFDKFTYNDHFAVLYAFRSPAAPTSIIESGLATALSEYREWAGRLGEDSSKNPVVLLNDEGVRFIEATVDSTLDKFMPFKPSPELLSLHASLHGVEELAQVQLTRFACGSMVLGFTAHHRIADGHGTSNLVAAWGLSSRGLAMGPLPLHERVGFFTPRHPPKIEFEHRGAEFKAAAPMISSAGNGDAVKDDIVVQQVNFTKEFLINLKAKASFGASGRGYSTIESLIAHLWRVTTKARGVDRHETTQVRISVNGRVRMKPRVPNEYIGNLVLWAFPRATVEELLSHPLPHVAALIHNAVARVDDGYFRSFIDFASSGAVEEEGLETTAEMGKLLCPNLEVDSWLSFPVYDLDFGAGSPYYFMPSYYPVEGMLFLLPSFMGDGSIDAFVPLFHQHLASFKQSCYSLD